MVRVDCVEREFLSKLQGVLMSVGVLSIKSVNLQGGFWFKVVGCWVSFLNLEIQKIRGHVERNSLALVRGFSLTNTHVRISLVSCTNLSAGAAIRAKGVLWFLWISTTSRWYPEQQNVPPRFRLILVISSFVRVRRLHAIPTFCASPSEFKGD